jgi:hypothetical protein
VGGRFKALTPGDHKIKNKKADISVQQLGPVVKELTHEHTLHQALMVPSLRESMGINRMKRRVVSGNFTEELRLVDSSGLSRVSTLSRIVRASRASGVSKTNRLLRSLTFSGFSVFLGLHMHLKISKFFGRLGLMWLFRF